MSYISKSFFLPLLSSYKIDIAVCCRLLVEARLPSIKKVVSLQTMMRALGKDIPLDLKRKLEVSL